MTAPRASLIVLASLAIGLAGCGGDPPPPAEAPANPEPPPPANPEPPPANPEPASSGQAGTAPAPAPAPPPLTDEQIAAITVAADTGEIDQAKAAQGKAKDAKVKKFAQTMITHHGESKKKIEGIVKKAKLTPADNDMSTKLAGDSKAAIDSWKDLKGADFDKAYIDAQVKNHQAVLDALDKQILPAVKNEELKKQIEGFRPKVEAHLKEAQDIQAHLAAAPAAATPATPAKPGAPGGGATPATPATPPKK
jgi:putative membrane protein